MTAVLPKLAHLPANDGWHPVPVLWDQRSKPNEAIVDLDRALELDQTNARIYVMRGFVRHREGELNLALQDFTAALALEPDDAYAIKHRNRILKKMGNPLRDVEK